MKLLVYVLSKPDVLQPLLKELLDANIKGVTILDSTGMGRVLADNNDDLSMYSALRALLSDNSKQTKTLLMVLKDELVTKAKTIIEKVVGPTGGPDGGIIFTLPVDFAKGFSI